MRVHGAQTLRWVIKKLAGARNMRNVRKTIRVQRSNRNGGP